MHIYGKCSPFKPSKSLLWEEKIVLMARKDENRLRYLSSLVLIASARQIIQSPTYIVRLWVPCNGCSGCFSKLFDSTKSTSYKTLGCGSAECKKVPNPTCGGSSVCTFNQTYGVSSFFASLTKDSVQLARDLIPNYSFACLGNVTSNSGTLVSPIPIQSLYKSTFSYCLPSFKSPNFSGSLSKVVDIPPSALAFNPTTSARTIFDSGTVYTRLVTPAYEAVRNEFRRRIKANVSSLGGFDTCYTQPIVAPIITLQFSGMNVTLPLDSILLHSTAGGTTCLATAAAPDNVNSGLNVLLICNNKTIGFCLICQIPGLGFLVKLVPDQEKSHEFTVLVSQKTKIITNNQCCYWGLSCMSLCFVALSLNLVVFRTLSFIHIFIV
ncbi:hypothetical protein MKX03_037657 [Papaver bracteatum]|nr:hypothetical protein MKX03_037657 [Papaver bracteatum]